MSNSYTDAFGGGMVPPSIAGYASYKLSGTTQATWPIAGGGASVAIAKTTELISLTSGAILQMPPADQVSTGEGSILRNLGAFAIAIQDAGGNALLTLSPGVAQYLYVTANNTTAGTWGQLTFGAGSSAISAGALAGLGTKAIGATLGTAATCMASGTDVILTPNHRGAALDFVGGSSQVLLSLTTVYGGDFFCYVKNSGTGLITIVPSGSDKVDTLEVLGLQPNESLILICNGAGQWITVGYGRSTIYQFSQLSLSVSAGGTFVLTSTQAANKLLTFTGNPAVPVTIVVPSTIAVYYALNTLSTNQPVIIKTALGTGISIIQSGSVIALCDGTNVSAAQSVAVTTVVSMLDGSVTSPALNFSSQPNTGFYKYSTQGIGVTVAGVSQWHSNGAGVEFPLGISIGGVPVSSAWSSITGKPTTLAGYGITDGWGTASHPTTLAGYGITDANPFPSGTKLMFAQAAAPVGWTQITTDEATSRLLRVVNTATHSTGGSHSPILNDVVPAHTHTITTGDESAAHTHSGTTGTESAAHTHGFPATPGAGNTGWMVSQSLGNQTLVYYQGATSTESAAHAHTFTTNGPTAPHTHSGTTDNGSSATSWIPRYIDMILCSKD